MVGAWTLLDGDWDLVGNKSGATRLGFGLLLKFFELEGRFPRHAGEVPKAAVDYVAGQVKVDPALLAEYDWSGRLRAEVLGRCRRLRIEPPGRVERIVGAGRARFEREFCTQVLNGLSADAARSLWELATGDDGFLLELKSDPGRLGLETLLEEIVKLRRARALGLPADLFGGVSDRLVASWRARAMASHPSDFAAMQPPVRLTLMAALAWSRTTEITDALVDLFIGLVSKVNTRAERKVDNVIEAEARKVHRKTEKLFSIAEASLREPDGSVRQVVFPAVAGGEATLKALVAEAKADAKAYKARVRTVLSSSYSNYYRQMLPKLLEAIEFKCNNTAYRPVSGARRWRDPEEDLLADFEDMRDVHYENLRRPLDPSVFIETLKEAMRASMQAGHAAGGDPQAAAAGPVRAGHERRDQAGRRRRPPRRDRSRTARHPAPVREPRQPARGGRDPGERDVEDAGPAVVGQRHRVRAPATPPRSRR
ncbi:hypothetical protein GCM10022221_14510 [Actinocorallia aurea]